ncbi:MAG: sigma-70 family RNA polymerase sigma factor [Acidobacteriia bacterium]|nr:sigma-70 family RNA polymerase sigma factor [Terriglobia bacterium]
MDPAKQGEITQLLNRNGAGREKCERLAELVYADLRQIASRVMVSEPQDHTLQPTVVATDAYLKLVEQPGGPWQSRHHFFAAAAKTMRQMLVDHGRKRRAQKRGGAAQRVDLDEVGNAKAVDLEELLALDEALTRLESIDKRQIQIVELRYFTGLTEEETAEVMGIGLRTVKREWAVARAWLHADLTRPPSEPAVKTFHA